MSHMFFQHQNISGLEVWRQAKLFFCKAAGHQRVTEGPPCCPCTKHPRILAKGTAVGGATVSSNSCHSKWDMHCTELASRNHFCSIFCSEKLRENHPKPFEISSRLVVLVDVVFPFQVFVSDIPNIILPPTISVENRS